MFVTKIKSVLAVVLIIAALAGAAGLLYQTRAAEQPKAKQEQLSSKKDQKKGEEKQGIGKNEQLRVLIDKVLAAHGGEEKLSKLKFIEEAETPNPPDPISVTYFVESSERFRENVTHTGVKYSVLPIVRFREEVKHAELTTSTRIHILQKDGMKRWTTYPKIEKEQWGGPDPMIEYWLDSVKFFGPRRVLRLKDADHRVALLDEVKIDGRPAVGVELTKAIPKFKMSLKMYFDKETRLLAKEENDFSYSAIIYPPLGYTPEWSPHEEKVHSSSAIFYTDYKRFDGIPIAQKEIYTANGKYVSETKVLDFRAVEKLDAKLFEQPRPAD